MKKNVIYLVFIGLVILFLAACTEGGAGRGADAGGTGTGGQMTTTPTPPTTKGVFSETHDLLDPDGTTISGLAADADGGANDTKITVEKTTTGAVDNVTPSEGNEMYKIEFKHDNWSGVYFKKIATADLIDLSAYAGGSIVFSVNYAGLTPAPSYFEAKITSDDPATPPTDNNEDGGGIVNFIGRASTTDGDWHTYEIPLADFNTIGYRGQTADLDLTRVDVYFGLWNPKKTVVTDANATPPTTEERYSTGNVYLDNIYFKPASTN